VPNVYAGTWRALNRFGIASRQEPKPDTSYKAPSDPVHVGEETGLPCPCGLLAIDTEAAYYRCNRVPKPERDRRIAANDYGAWAATLKGRAIRKADQERARPVAVVKVETDTASEREVHDQRLTDDLIQTDLGRRDPVLENVQRRIDVSTGVEPLINARDLPEARPAPMRRNLHSDVGGGRAHSIAVYGNRKIDESSHQRAS